ncbi:uncharacterized protein [Nicotiana tomentosiformis]|uniref:uncharacterized protein n=1 Tax=Nicotiana tomentosiformis TaxID=4098 RepID=UPI00388C89AA
MVYQAFEVVVVDHVEEGKPILHPRLSATSVMVVALMLRQGYDPGKGLGASLQGILEPISPFSNNGTFGLGFRQTQEDEDKAKHGKRHGWVLQQPIPHIFYTFVKPRLKEGQNSRAQAGEGTSRADMQLIGPDTMLKNWEAIPLPTRKESCFVNVGFNNMTCMRNSRPDLKKLSNFEIMHQEVEFDENEAVEEIKIELEQFENKPRPNLNETEPINIGGHKEVRETKISIHTEQETRDALIQILFEYRDVFVWSYDDIPGLSADLVVHKLPTYPDFLPVQQKQRKFKTNMSDKIKEELMKQLSTNVVRAVRYTTGVANIVPVLKKDGKTRVCVDYRVCVDPSDLLCQSRIVPVPKTDVWQSSGRTIAKMLLTGSKIICQNPLYIPRFHNELADALATLASMLPYPSNTHIDPLGIQVRNQHGYCNTIETEPDGKPCYPDIKRFLKTREYPEHAKGDQKRTIRRLADGFFLNGEILYKKTPNLNLLRCVDATEAERIMNEVHSGPKVSNGHRFILVAIDYFTKWVEAVTFKAVTKKAVVDFVHSNIICRFGIPKTIITDNAANLNSHLVKELSFALLGYRTTARTSVGATPYLLVYGTEAIIPAEVEISSLRIVVESEIEDTEWVKTRLEQLMPIDEKWLAAVCFGQLYQQRMARAYNKKVRLRHFKVGQLILKRILPHQVEAKEKFALNWQGPYIIKKVLPKEALHLVDDEGRVPDMTINADAVKRYYLVLVGENSVQKSTANHKATRKLNPAATIFNPTAPGITMLKKTNNTNVNGSENAGTEGVLKETTAQWVSRAFDDNLVLTNQSCQEIPSQSVDTNAPAAVLKEFDRLQLSGSRLWCQQLEEGSEDGELPQGVIGDDEVTEEEREVDEQNDTTLPVDGIHNVTVIDPGGTCDNKGEPFVQGFNSDDADILADKVTLQEGETHLQRRPNSTVPLASISLQCQVTRK